MKINPNDSATGFAFSNDQRGNTGLTIRAQIAAMAMQGMLASGSYRAYTADEASNIVIQHTDALIEKLNETSNLREIPIVPPKDREILNEG